MDAPAPPARSWTSGPFAPRYWGFLWRGVLAGMLSMLLIGPWGLLRSFIEIARGHLGDIGGHLLTPVVGSLIGAMYWIPLSLPTALVPTLVWPRLRLPLDRRQYRALWAVALVSGTLVEAMIALGLARSGLNPGTPFDWETFLFICHGTGALTGYLVLRWTPEARDYRHRRKSAKQAGPGLP